jgi:hypothetical protein
MPGQTGVKGETPVIATEATVGNVVTHEVLDIHLMRNQARARELCAYTTPSGDRYTVAYLERCGFALYSHQDAQCWIFELKDMVALAKAAGLDREVPTIIVPGKEAFRG